MDDDPSPAKRPAALEVHVSSAVGRLPLGRARVAAIATSVLRGERCHSAMLTVTFVSDRAIAGLHRRHLQVDGPTDIITFQHAPTHRGGPRVGDIYIAPAVARRHARLAGCSWREELARLTIHGVLHALGWEHPDGDGRLGSAMWRRQERWVARLAQDGAW
jgi:probable rRNA maturation factor